MTHPNPNAPGSFTPAGSTYQTAHSEAAPSPANRLLNVDRIFGTENEFKQETWGPAHWLKDSSGYTTLEVSPEFIDNADSKKIKDIVGPKATILGYFRFQVGEQV